MQINFRFFFNKYAVAGHAHGPHAALRPLQWHCGHK